MEKTIFRLLYIDNDVKDRSKEKAIKAMSDGGFELLSDTVTPTTKIRILQFTEKEAE